jgi:hypothetical protein
MYVAQWEVMKLSNREGLDLHNSVGFEFSRSEGLKLIWRAGAGAKKGGGGNEAFQKGRNWSSVREKD